MTEGQDQIRSGSGIPIEDIYTPEDMEGTSYERDIGLPGQPPFTRGVYPNMYRGRLFTIRRYSGVNTPEDTNELYRREYELGQTGFSMAFDVPTGFGLDSDDPRAYADVGGDGEGWGVVWRWYDATRFAALLTVQPRDVEFHCCRLG